MYNDTRGVDMKAYRLTLPYKYFNLSDFDFLKLDHLYTDEYQLCIVQDFLVKLGIVDFRVEEIQL